MQDGPELPSVSSPNAAHKAALDHLACGRVSVNQEYANDRLFCSNMQTLVVVG